MEKQINMLTIFHIKHPPKLSGHQEVNLSTLVVTFDIMRGHNHDIYNTFILLVLYVVLFQNKIKA